MPFLQALFRGLIVGLTVLGINTLIFVLSAWLHLEPSASFGFLIYTIPGLAVIVRYIIVLSRIPWEERKKANKPVPPAILVFISVLLMYVVDSLHESTAADIPFAMKLSLILPIAVMGCVATAEWIKLRYALRREEEELH